METKIYLLGLNIVLETSETKTLIPTRCGRIEPHGDYVQVSDYETKKSINLLYSEVKDQDGAGFGSLDDTITYLTEFIGGFKQGGADGMGSDFSGSYVDLTDKPDLSIYQPKLSLEGGVFCVFAEESQWLNSDRFEWSYGNGDESSNGFGIVLPFNCELIALTLNTKQGVSTVEAYKNTDSTGKTVLSDDATRRGYNDFKDSPLSFSPGDCINFKTISSSDSSGGGKVAAWFLVK